MHLSPNTLKYGVEPRILLDGVGRLLDRVDGSWRPSFDLESFCEALGAPAREAQPVLDAMVKDGLVELTADPASPYTPTPQLSRLRGASLHDGIARHEAEALLARVVAAAQEINADPTTYGHVVRGLVVFGSFLTDKAVLGDLDFGVDMQLLPAADKAIRDRFHDWQYLDAWKAEDRLKRRAYSKLRLRKPQQISLHAFEEVKRLGTPYRVLFGSPEAIGGVAEDQPALGMSRSEETRRAS